MSQKRVNTGASHGSLKSYGIGFFLSIILTLVAFWAVMSGVLPRQVVLAVVLCSAMFQILVQLHFFLHLDFSSAARWNLLALLFTIMILVLFVGASLWIIGHLNTRLM